MKVYFYNIYLDRTICAKGLFMFLNLVFWVIGLAILGIGIWMQRDLNIYLKISRHYSPYLPYCIIIIGCIIVCATLFTCSCIAKMQSSLLIFYYAFLLAMFVSSLALTIYIYTYKNHVVEEFSNDIHHNSNTFTDVKAKNLLQKKLQCSVIEQYNDRTNKICCFNEQNNPNTNLENIIENCSSKLQNFIDTHLTIAALMIAIFGLFSLCGSIVVYAIFAKNNTHGYVQIV